MTLRVFARIFGAIFLIVGVAGFIPALAPTHSHPDVIMNASMGMLLGLFPVNILHNIVHLIFGLWALVASASFGASRFYFRSVAVIYALLAIMGLIDAGNLYTTFGLIPLYGNDVWLHGLIAAVSGYLGFIHREQGREATAGTPQL
ncbi:DUF4383 domain-containing protein [Rhizorhapis suberifaciens]|uniref:DUF4383 domain-containing protein n=1 Tax=Rhizorhapis suberifaciens TaxID=13656 RepID=A0A840HY49_9SPHN|nr:DUF4383 domain-containing protein [Rhizorhapis suberifaciens]MBB4642489.1 hypothetical protein [Rhizorhapis suberifaciens]